MDDLRKKAEGIVRVLRKRDTRIISISEPVNYIEQALRDVRMKTIKKVVKILDDPEMPCGTCPSDLVDEIQALAAFDKLKKEVEGE